MIYKLSSFVGQVVQITEQCVSTIPFDPANTDYAAYLAWLADGNTPEPADPLPEPVQVDPAEKLRAFLSTNPDVAAIL